MRKKKRISDSKSLDIGNGNIFEQNYGNKNCKYLLKIIFFQYYQYVQFIHKVFR